MPQRTPTDVFCYERAHFIVALLYFVAARVGELPRQQMGDFQQREDPNAGPVWVWTVVGKGGKYAEVPVVDELLAALKRYRRSLRRFGYPNLTDLPAPKEAMPLIVSQRRVDGIRDKTMIYRLVKGLLERAAEKLEGTDAWRAERLRQASTHWIRHAAITRAAAGAKNMDDMRDVQLYARHGSVQTTLQYVHSPSDGARRAARKLERSTTDVQEPVAAAPSRPVAPASVAQVLQGKQTVIRLSLRVENNSKFVRGRKRTIAAIEDYLSEYNVKILGECEYEITVSYEDEDGLERAVNEIIANLDEEADMHHCFIEASGHDTNSDLCW